MRSGDTLRRSVARLVVGAAAVGSGAGVGHYTDIARYTDLARHELHASHPHVRTEPLPRPSDLAEARTADRTAIPSSGLAALADASEPGNDGREVPDAALTLAPPPNHDALLTALTGGRVMTGATPHRLILFTFDDGPSRFTTPLLLDRLDAAGVRAIFFLTGSNLRGVNVAERQHQAIARETARRGHFLASHGYLHRQLPLLDDAQANAELSQTEALFEVVLGGRPVLFRPPGGARSSRIDRLVADRGYTMVLWNLGAGDFQVRTAAEVHQTWRAVLERREAQGERGGIILLHDTYAWSVEAFQLIVQDLLDRNCALLESDEELYDFVDDPSLFFEARNGAGPSKEARPAVITPELLAMRQARVRQETEQRCQAVAQR